MPAGLVTLTAVVAASLLLAVVLRRREGRTRTVVSPAGFHVAELVGPLGVTATFVQFSTTTCAPCRSVRRVLADFTADRPHVVHRELDAEQHLELVRKHRVFTTSTVLVLDGDGRVRQRLTGLVDRRGLHRALATVTPTPPSETPHG